MRDFLTRLDFTRSNSIPFLLKQKTWDPHPHCSTSSHTFPVTVQFFFFVLLLHFSFPDRSLCLCLSPFDLALPLLHASPLDLFLCFFFFFSDLGRGSSLVTPPMNTGEGEAAYDGEMVVRGPDRSTSLFLLLSSASSPARSGSDAERSARRHEEMGGDARRRNWGGVLRQWRCRGGSRGEERRDGREIQPAYFLDSTHGVAVRGGHDLEMRTMVVARTRRFCRTEQGSGEVERWWPAWPERRRRKQGRGGTVMAQNREGPTWLRLLKMAKGVPAGESGGRKWGFTGRAFGVYRGEVLTLAVRSFDIKANESKGIRGIIAGVGGNVWDN